MKKIHPKPHLNFLSIYTFPMLCFLIHQDYALMNKKATEIAFV